MKNTLTPFFKKTMININEDDKTLVKYVKEKSTSELLKYLENKTIISNEKNPSYLCHSAVENYDLTTLNILIDHGADIWQENQEIRHLTPIILAADKGYWELVKVIANAKSPDKKNQTNFGFALTIAVSRDKKDIVELLVQKKASYMVSINGGTSLHWAVIRRNFAIAKLLYDYKQAHPPGKQHNIVNEQGKTANRLMGYARMEDCLDELKSYKEIQRLKSDYLNLCIIFAFVYKNPKTSQSTLSILPQEILFKIASFFDFNGMRKKPEEGDLLIKEIFNRFKEIKEMVGIPGGINVFQQNKKFTFYQSVSMLCQQYNELENELTSKQILEIQSNDIPQKNKFRKEVAISVWQSHVGIFKFQYEKQELLRGIAEHPLYEPILSQLKK